MNTNSLIELRATKISDLETLFQFQLDKEGGHMAAFMPENASDKAAYLTKYMKLLNDPSVNNQTLLLNKSIVGSMASFSIEGEREITYRLTGNFGDKK